MWVLGKYTIVTYLDLFREYNAIPPKYNPYLLLKHREWGGFYNALLIECASQASLKAPPAHYQGPGLRQTHVFVRKGAIRSLEKDCRNM